MAKQNSKPSDQDKPEEKTEEKTETAPKKDAKYQRCADAILNSFK